MTARGRGSPWGGGIRGWLSKARFGFPEGQRGISLIETLVALGILAAIGVAFLSGLNTISKGTGLHAERITAANLAQSQMEEIKAMPYDPTAPNEPAIYPVVVTPPPGYTVIVTEVEVASDKQQVTVAISRGGKVIVKLATTKTKWQ